MIPYYPLGDVKTPEAVGHRRNDRRRVAMHTEIILAGFGGQGVLLIGKLLAYAGMKAGQRSHLDAGLRPRDARRHVQLHGGPVATSQIGSPVTK